MFRRLDGLAEDIQRFQPPVELWRKFIYCTSLTGSTIGSVDHMQTEGKAYQTILSPKINSLIVSTSYNAKISLQLECYI